MTVDDSEFSAMEVAPPLDPMWKKNAHSLRALPCCRTCAIGMNLKNLTPYPDKYQCQIARCENESAYLAIM